MDFLARSPVCILCLTSTLALLSACSDEDLVGIPGELQGKACDLDTGLPLASTTLTLEAGGAVHTALSSVDGSFRFNNVEAGLVKLHLPQGERGGAARTEELMVSPQESQVFSDQACRELPMPPMNGTVDGQICNRHTGALVGDAAVTVTTATLVWRTTTDADGRFLLEDLPRGEHVLTVQGDGFSRAFLIDIAAGNTTHLELGEDCTETTASMGTLSGSLCDLADPTEALVGATISTVDASGNTVSDVTDTNGLFFLNALAPGPATVRIERAPDVNNFYSLNVVAGEDRVVVRQLCGEEPPPPPPPALLGNIVVEPALHDFGILELAQTDELTIAIGNDGAAPLIVSSVSYAASSADLQFNANVAINGTLPWTLAPGAAINVVVRYAPSDGSADTGTLTVLSDDVDEPSSEASQTGNGRTFEGFSTGWYIVDDHTNYQTTANPSHTVDHHGDLDGYWYEPSGAHGLLGSANPAADFQRMHDYVIARAGASTPVSGPLTFVSSSSVPSLTSASYSYILCDFWLDPGEDPSRYSVSSGTVDDGILVLVNGEMLGNLLLGQSGSWQLDNAVAGQVNTLIVILMDNARTDKYLHDLAFRRDGVMVTEP